MKMKIKNIYALAFCSMTVVMGNALAQEYASVLTIARLRVHEGYAQFGTSVQPKNTCSNYGEYFKVDLTTVDGRHFLATLLTAKAADKPIDVWYTTSSAPGTDATNGCNGTTVSVLKAVSIR